MFEGCVEIKYKGFWGIVCDDYWIFKEVNIVCRLLGFGFVVVVMKVVYYGKGVGKVSS